MTLRLKHIATVSKGRTSASLANNELRGVPLLHMSALRSKSCSDYVEGAKVDCEKGEIVVCWDGSNSGEFFRAQFSGCLASTIGLIKTSKNVDRAFIYYLLKSKEEHLRKNIVGMGIPHVNPNVLRNIAIPQFDLATQRQIADFLDCEIARIDLLIEKKQRLVALIAERATSLITQVTKHGLNGETHVDTGIDWWPRAPMTWKVHRIASLFRESKEMGKECLPVLSVSIKWGISDRELADEDRDRSVNLIEDKTSYKRVRPGDLVYNTMRAWQGAFGAAKVDGLVSPAYVVARPRKGLHPAYFGYLLRTPSCVEEFRRASKGIADFRQRLYWEHFRQVQLVLPKYQEQVDITAYIKREQAQTAPLVSKTQESVDRLYEYRSALITAAVTGQIDVQTYEKSGTSDRHLAAIQEEMGA